MQKGAQMDATTKSWRIPPEPVSDSQITQTITADVLILGGGIAGVAAARSAAESGVSVAVLEKQREERHIFYGGEMGTINSKFLLDAGVEPIDPMDFVNEWQRRNLNRTNPQLIRQFAFHSGETMDWFLELLPEDFKKTLHIFSHPLPKYYTGEVAGVRNWRGSVLFRGKGTNWGDAMQLMVEKAKELGATFYYRTPAEQLIKEEGRVTGAVAKDADGNYLKFIANKGVLIACGDFSANHEMVVDLIEELVDVQGDQIGKFRGAGRNGDGQKLGVWAGGRMEPGPRAIMGGLAAGGGGAFGSTAFLKINKNGERFTNEASWAFGSQGVRQPKGSICTVWDANWREELEYQSPDHGNVDVSYYKLERMVEEMNALIVTGAAGGIVHDTFTIEGAPHKTYSADTLDELAGHIGYKDEAKEKFLATIERYNELARKGKDEDFGKDPRLMHPLETPPFYGFYSRNDRGSFALVTLAGLMIDKHQNVLDENDEPIPGLFATGNSSGGRYAMQYCTPIAGNSIGIAMTLGRIAGKHIAGL